MCERVLARNLRLIAFIFLAIITPFIHAAAVSTNNSEIPSVISCTKKGNSNTTVCCRPSKWADILTFYSINYFAHAATTRTRPGQSTFSTLCIIALALLFPMSGALRGVEAIRSMAAFADTDLQKAAQAGALCMVVKVPRDDGERRPVRSGLMTKIQGRCTLPPDHVLMTVPRDATFIEDEVSSSGPQDSLWRKSLSAVPKAITSYWKPQQNTSTTAIPSSYSALKSLVAVTQALFAATTLYNSKGHQIDRFGYAAFGLTVVPYALMSIVNLIANLVCPEYPAMYLISNQALQNLQHQYDSWSLEARQDKAARPTATQQDIDSSGQGHINIFQADHSAVKQEQPDKVQKKNDDSKDQKFEVSGIVGALSIKSDRAIQQELNHEIDSATYRGITDLSQLDIARSDKSFSSFLPSVLIITGVVIGIIGGLSHFHQGSSTTAQRVWTMIWLSFGLFIGIITYNTAELLERRGVLNLEPSPNASSDWKDLLANLVFFIIVPIPAIGGLVVVGQMIHSYGVCNVF